MPDKALDDQRAAELVMSVFGEKTRLPLVLIVVVALLVRG